MENKKCIRCGKVRYVTKTGKHIGLCRNCIITKNQNQRKKMDYVSKKNTYNKINKNYVRKKLIEVINLKGINTILTLESADFLFANQLPNKKIFVFEYAPLEFNKMKKKKPFNVVLFQGEISQSSEMDNKFDCIYLDFCSGVTEGLSTISKMKDKISESKLFGVTFCMRNFIAEECDYQFEIQKKIYEATETPMIPIYGYTYRDDHRNGAVMITILFENQKQKEGKE